MRKIISILCLLALGLPVFSQTTTPKKQEVLTRPGDHLMIQFSYDFWLNAPDSIKNQITGFNRGFNAYIMYDMPFKGDPRFSVAGGAGISTSNIFFEKMAIEVDSKNSTLPFTKLDNQEYFKKYKLTTAYLEIPLEFRFSAHPSTPSKSIKAALGVKIGTLVNAHSKGKTLRDANGRTINDKFIEKKHDRSYFNGTRFAATARIGYGNFSLFGAYNLGSIFKDGVAPDIKLLQIGLTLSGL